MRLSKNNLSDLVMYFMYHIHVSRRADRCRIRVPIGGSKGLAINHI